MTPPTTAKWMLLLSTGDGEIRWSLAAAGVFLLAFGLDARSRIVR